jgi:glycine reductase complex component B subunit gamma
MAQKKLRVVHYLNQFFGQIGGEEKATTGFMVKEGPVGPGLALQKELGDRAEIIATVICGDDYFAVNPDQCADEGLKLVASYQPDLFFAGPAFAAGRYSIACGAMCKAVGGELSISVITGMHEEAPGMELYRKYAFICKTGNIVRGMPEVVRNMVRLAFRLISGEKETRILTRENLPKPEEYNYFSRNLLRNEYCEKSIAERSVEMLVAKLQGKPFESEVIPPKFERVTPPAPIKDLSKCEIALISDGGLVPKGNPDGLARRSNLRWGAYEIDALFNAYEITHAGYFNDHVLERPDRLVPVDVMRDLAKEGKIGKLHPTFFSTSGCTTVSKRCGEMGDEMGAEMKKRKSISAVILTST